MWWLVPGSGTAAGSIPGRGRSRWGPGIRAQGADGAGIRPIFGSRTPGTVPCPPAVWPPRGPRRARKRLVGPTSPRSRPACPTRARRDGPLRPSVGACRGSPGRTSTSATCAWAATSSAGRRTSRRPSRCSTGTSTRRPSTRAAVRRHRGVLRRRDVGADPRRLDGLPRGPRPRRRGHQGLPRRQGAPAGGGRDPRGGRAVAAQPADRRDRPLLRALRRRDDAAGGDAARRSTSWSRRARSGTWPRRTTRRSG